MSPGELWRFLPLGYAMTVAVELPVLYFGLAAHHPKRRRIAAGFLLTAATYPVVVLVLPLVMESASRAAYLAVAETFAPVAEAALFQAAFTERGEPRTGVRDSLVIVLANLASFGAGEAAFWFGWV